MLIKYRQEMGFSATRVSSKRKKWVRTKTNRNKIFFGCVSVCLVKPKSKISFLFRTYIETTETNRTLSTQTETNRNNHKFTETYQNMLSIKLFRLVFCLFRFNPNTGTRCFGIEFKTTETNCFETNRNNIKFL